MKRLTNTSSFPKVYSAHGGVFSSVIDHDATDQHHPRSPPLAGDSLLIDNSKHILHIGTTRNATMFAMLNGFPRGILTVIGIKIYFCYDKSDYADKPIFQS